MSAARISFLNHWLSVFLSVKLWRTFHLFFIFKNWKGNVNLHNASAYVSLRYLVKESWKFKWYILCRKIEREREKKSENLFFIKSKIKHNTTTNINYSKI